MVKDSLLENIIKPNNCDVFCHCWPQAADKVDIENKHPSYRIPDCFNPLFVDEIIDFLKPKSFLQEKPHYPEDVSNTICRNKSLFYSIMMSNKLKKNFEDMQKICYDIVIRARWDLAYHTVLNLSKYQNDTIYIGNRPGSDSNGLNDWFAYGDSEIMNSYSDMFNVYEHITKRLDGASRQHHPENIVGEHLRNITKDRAAVLYSIVRPNGIRLPIYE